MQVYSRYGRVETIGGEPVPVREALAAINQVIANYDERQQGDLDSVRALLTAGAEINAATPQHGNVLTVASGSGHKTLSIFLLEKGADPNSPDHRGVTPLHSAVPQ